MLGDRWLPRLVEKDKNKSCINFPNVGSKWHGDDILNNETFSIYLNFDELTHSPYSPRCV